MLDLNKPLKFVSSFCSEDNIHYSASYICSLKKFYDKNGFIKFEIEFCNKKEWTVLANYNEDGECLTPTILDSFLKNVVNPVKKFDSILVPSWDIENV